MRPPEPEVVAALEAIDAALAGEPVDPGLVDVAELSLILRDERPAPSGTLPESFDDLVAPAPPRRPRRFVVPGAIVTAAAAGIVAVVLAAGGGGGASSSSSSSSGSSASSTASSAGSAANPHARSSAGAATSAAPTPPGAGHRQIIQSAQLALSTSSGRIDDVAQQVFDVVGAEQGVLQSSNVTSNGAAGGSADFQLSVPSSHLSQALTQLSQLRGARVVSRSDASSDVTGQVGGAGRRLAEARALQRSLLKRLAAAVTTEQVDSLKGQLAAAGAAIGRDQAALSRLHHQVGNSSIAVTLHADLRRAPAAHGRSFTFGRAAHDAARVLVVAAGVALIALAVLVPLGLAAALVTWLVAGARRRRREGALDGR